MHLQVLFWIFLSAFAFLDDPYKMPKDFCANRCKPISQEPEGITYDFTHRIEHPDGGLTECHFVEEKADETAGGIVGAEHALRAGAGIAEEQERHAEQPENILRGDGKSGMADAPPEQAESVEEDPGGDAEQDRSAEQGKLLPGRPEGIGDGMRRHRNSLPSAVRGARLSLSP